MKCVYCSNELDYQNIKYCGHCMVYQPEVMIKNDSNVVYQKKLKKQMDILRKEQLPIIIEKLRPLLMILIVNTIISEPDSQKLVDINSFIDQLEEKYCKIKLS